MAARQLVERVARLHVDALALAQRRAGGRRRIVALRVALVVGLLAALVVRLLAALVIGRLAALIVLPALPVVGRGRRRVGKVRDRDLAV